MAIGYLDDFANKTYIDVVVTQIGKGFASLSVYSPHRAANKAFSEGLTDGQQMRIGDFIRIRLRSTQKTTAYFDIFAPKSMAILRNELLPINPELLKELRNKETKQHEA